jgi:pseudouridine kinase
MTKREQQIIDAINENPLISQHQLADQLKISRSAIASHITNLTAKGVIEGRGYVIAPEKFCVAIGGANIDILGTPTQPISAMSSNPGIVSTSAGGVARNIAENIARLGNKCYLIAPVGDDSYGRQLIEQSHSAGIDTSQILTIDGQSTSSYLSIVDDNGEMQLAIADMNILDCMLPALLKRQMPLLKRAQTIVLDTNIDEKLLSYLFDSLPKASFFVDTVSIAKASKILPYLAKVYCLKPNLLEAQALSGMQIEDYSQLPQLAQWFHKQGVKQLYISLGEDGLFFSDQNQSKQVKIPAKTVSNSNGAGDALSAALVHCQLSNLPIEESAYFALAAANCAITSTQTINPDFSLSSINKILEEAQC